MPELIEIDGSYGEGGGQILRTSLSLSILTQIPVRIFKIRANRKNPGLRPQHLLSAESARTVSGGTLEGGRIGSTEISFFPGTVRQGEFSFDVGEKTGSAGSINLVFQTLLLPLAFGKGSTRLYLKGGTHVPWSPPSEYIREVFLPTVSAMGLHAEYQNPVCGFYPVGGGEADILIHPLKGALKPLRVEKRGPLKRLHVLSQVANLPIQIARRQLKQVQKVLSKFGSEAEGECGELSSPGKGTACFILAEFEHTRAGFSALGAVGKTAEKVGEEAVDAFMAFWKGQGVLDDHLSDQILPYMAMARGESVIALSKITDHLKTNVWVIEQFLSVKFHIEKNQTFSLSLRGAL